MSSSRRYVRQERLLEIGPAGQARLCAASLSTFTDGAAEVEREYLQRAGVHGVFVEAEARPPEFAHAHLFEFEAARTLGEGSWRALGQIKQVLELEA